MTLYMFERTGGTLNIANVKAIIKAAGYDPSALVYKQVDPKHVNATGAVVMAPSTLEHAAKQLGYKGTTVTVVEGVAEEADARQRALSGSSPRVSGTFSVPRIMG